jgi:hypothetical protein
VVPTHPPFAVAAMQPPFADSPGTVAWFSHPQRQRAKETETALQRGRGSEAAAVQHSCGWGGQRQ